MITFYDDKGTLGFAAAMELLMLRDKINECSKIQLSMDELRHFLDYVCKAFNMNVGDVLCGLHKSGADRPNWCALCSRRMESGHLERHLSALGTETIIAVLSMAGMLKGKTADNEIQAVMQVLGIELPAKRKDVVEFWRSQCTSISTLL